MFLPTGLRFLQSLFATNIFSALPVNEFSFLALVALVLEFMTMLIQIHLKLLNKTMIGTYLRTQKTLYPGHNYYQKVLVLVLLIRDLVLLETVV